MRLSLLSLAIIGASCLSVARSSPIAEDDAQVVARSMLGNANNLVSWDSQPLERSPADPDVSELEKRVVYNPPVTTPSTGTVWHAGRKETVRWQVNQDDIPAQAKNFEATIKLGYLPKDGSGGYNLKWTLAKNIPITDEEADITLPKDLEARSDYIIVVMGDSGNRSKKFSIRKAAAQTNNAATCNTAKSANKHPHPTVSKEQRSVEERSQDSFASNMIGRDVQQSS